MTTIRISRSTTENLPNTFRHCIGTGRLGLALQEEYAKHLRLVQEEIGFSYIRGHGLFHEDLAIYREIETEQGIRPFYNFTYLDRVFDLFLEVGLKPFIEIGFMPKAMASGEQTIFYWKGNVTPPADFKKWEDLVYETVMHLLRRYGHEEVRTWPFEIWNEPNLINFWENADKEAYFKLYQHTVKAIHQADEQLLVGGPAICGGSDEWIDDFLAFSTKNNLRVDFVSRHAYTSKPPIRKTPDYYYQELAPSSDFFDQLKPVREQINEAGYSDRPFHITEYNTSYSPICQIHDLPYNAAYLAPVLTSLHKVVDSFSYWTFSDVFEEYDVPRSVFHGGFGLVALHSIKKPTYHLFRFVRNLGSDILYQDNHMIITHKSNGDIAILAWNPTGQQKDTLKLDYELEVNAGDYFIERERVHEHAANPFRVWRQLGRPRFPTKQQVNILKRHDMPAIETTTISPSTNTLTLDLELLPNEVTFITLANVHDETNTYIGLNEQLLPIAYNESI